MPSTEYNIVMRASNTEQVLADQQKIARGFRDLEQAAKSASRYSGPPGNEGHPGSYEAYFSGPPARIPLAGGGGGGGFGSGWGRGLGGGGGNFLPPPGGYNSPEFGGGGGNGGPPPGEGGSPSVWRRFEGWWGSRFGSRFRYAGNNFGSSSPASDIEDAEIVSDNEEATSGGGGPPSKKKSRYRNSALDALRMFGVMGGAAEAFASSSGVLGGASRVLGGAGAAVGALAGGPLGIIAGLALTGLGGAASSSNNLANNAFNFVTQYWTSGVYQKLGMSSWSGSPLSFYDYMRKNILRGGDNNALAIPQEFVNQYLNSFTSTGGTGNLNTLQPGMFWASQLGVNPGIAGALAGGGNMMGLDLTAAFGTPNPAGTPAGGTNDLKGILGRAARGFGLQNTNTFLSTITALHQMQMANGILPYSSGGSGSSSSNDVILQQLLGGLAGTGAGALTPIGATSTFSQATSAAMSGGTLSSPFDVIAIQRYMVSHPGATLSQAQAAVEVNPLIGINSRIEFAKSASSNPTIQQEILANSLGMQGNMQGVIRLLDQYNSTGGFSDFSQVQGFGFSFADRKKANELPTTEIGVQQAAFLADFENSIEKFKIAVTKFVEGAKSGQGVPVGDGGHLNQSNMGPNGPAGQR